MPLRINPIVLLGLVIALILSVAIFASAQGGSGDALSIATGQVGKPYAFGTDGPGSFSCVGLVRYALREAGVDANAPWDHGAYLSVYPTRATPQPGDVVVYPDGVAMYVGDGTVVMANEVDGVVGMYPMNSIGTPLGFANPYGGAADPAAAPTATDPMAADQQGTGMVDTLAQQQATVPATVDQYAVDQAPAPVDTTLAPVDTTLAPVGQETAPVDTTPAPIGQETAPVGTTLAPVGQETTPIDTPVPF